MTTNSIVQITSTKNRRGKKNTHYLSAAVYLNEEEILIQHLPLTTLYRVIEADSYTARLQPLDKRYIIAGIRYGIHLPVSSWVELSLLKQPNFIKKETE